jgi:hypothetical protein
MAASFEVAEAYADFHVNVDKGLDDAVAKIKARAKDLDLKATAKVDADTTLAEARIKALASEQNTTTIKADADTRLARAKIAELAAAKNAAIVKVDADISKAQLTILSLEEQRGKAGVTVDVDAQIAKAQAQIASLQAKKVRLEIEVDDTSLKGAGRKVDDEMSKVASRANAKFSALTFAALSLGLPAAAAAGAVGVVGALAIAGGAFAAFGVSAAMGTQEAQTALDKLTAGVRTTIAQVGQPMRAEVVGAIDAVTAAWGRLSPQIRAGAQASAPAVDLLTHSVISLAEGAMPGLLIAAKNSLPALQGVDTFARQAGTGVGQFFTNASQGALGAQQGFTIFGGTVQTLESRMGSLFANLANGSAGPLRSLDTIVDQVTQGLLHLTAQGSGAMGFLQGFTSAGSGLATVLNGVLTAVSALPPQVTQLGGSFTATAMLAQKLGIDATAGFQGLGKSVKEAGVGLQGAEKAGAKFGTAIGGLAAGAINPAFLAVSALSIGLSLLGQSQEKAAAYAAAHRDNVQALTQALREDNGVLGTNSAQVNSKALADKNAAANLNAFGVGMGTATLAIQNNSQAQDKLKFSAEGTLATIAKQAGLSDDNAQALTKLGGTALSTGKNYDQLKDEVLATGVTFDSSGESAQRLTGAQQTLIEQVLNGTGAVGEQINAARQAHDAYIAEQVALTNLSAAQIEARDATAQHTAAIYEGINASLGYRGAVLNSKAAVDEMNKVNRDSKSTEDQKATALLGAETAMQRQIAAAGALAVANNSTKSDGEKLTLQTQAQTAETIKLATAWSGPLPASLQTAIAQMSYTDATAAGLKVSVNKLGQAVVTLPDGKQIVLTSTAAAEQARVQNLLNTINALHDRDLKITVSYYGDASRATSLTGPRVAIATGGRPKDLVPHLAGGGEPLSGPLNVLPGGRAKGPGTGTSDSILAAISTEEMVTNARDTERNLHELYAINSGQRNYEQYPDTGRPPSRPLLGGGSAGSGAAGPVFNIYQQPGQDMFALAMEVNRLLEQDRKVS